MNSDLLQLLALLRAQLAIYQDAHWEVTGPNFYADHLLFERLYGSVGGEVDTLAEKMVAMYGPKAVDVKTLAGLTLRWVEQWSTIECLHKRGLQSEADFRRLTKQVYDRLDQGGALSMGMDDFLMAMVNTHESNQYLLLQTQRT